MRHFSKIAFWTICLMLIVALAQKALAHDHGRTDPYWESLRPEIQQWMKNLMRPDAPNLSCCGEADHYWCDDYYARDGKAYCKITDDREDNQFGRPHIPLGTEFEIPPEKLKHDRGNPTGHNILFVKRGSGWETNPYIFCFVQNGGV